MKITPEDVRKMNFGKVIADDALTFLKHFSKDGNHTSRKLRLDGQSLFYLLRLLFHMQLYRLYAEMRDPAIDKVIDQLVVLIGKRISPDRINNLVTVFSSLADEPEHTAMDGFSVPFSATNRDAETVSAFQAFYAEVNKVIEDYPDDFRMLVIRLIDLADKLSSVSIYPFLRKEVLKQITKRSFRREHRADLWTNSRRSMVKTFKSLIMMERLPYLLTVFFAIIGFLITNLLNEYKDMCIVKYDRKISEVTVSDILASDYGKIVRSNQNNFLDNPCPQCKSRQDEIMHLLKNICGIRIDGKNKFYKSNITFRNISKFYIKNIELNFKFKGDDRVIMGFAQTSSLVRSEFAEPEVYGTKASFTGIILPPGSNITLELITNTPDLPMNLSQPDDKDKIFLMKANSFNWIIDSRLNTIYALIFFSTFIIILNLILYAKFSNQED